MVLRYYGFLVVPEGFSDASSIFKSNDTNAISGYVFAQMAASWHGGQENKI